MEIYNRKNLKNNKGQSLFEVVVAMALISIVLITIVAMASVSIRSSVFSRNQTQASKYTEQAAEWLRSEKDASWVAFIAHASTRNWCLDSLYWQKGSSCGSSDLVSGTPYQRNLLFTVRPDNSVSADVVTTWVDAQGSHTVSSSTIFTNWASDFIAGSGPSTPAPCAGILPGNYTIVFAGAFAHTMTISSQSGDGSFSGSGFYNPDPRYTWTITGIETNGSSVSFTLVYTGLAAGYTVVGTAVVNGDGSWSGSSNVGSVSATKSCQ